MYNNSQITPANQTAIGTTANFAFNGDGSLYSGLLTVTAGWLQAGSANAFGNANITIAGGNAINGVGGPAQFNATVDFASAGTLTISDVNNTLSLDNNLTFSDAFIDGFDLLTALGAGSWNASQINGATGQGNVFGPALLTIGSVPEPSSISLAIMGGLGLMMFCRRRRS